MPLRIVEPRIIASSPLAAKVTPNIWHGFRVKATLENEANWYPVNDKSYLYLRQLTT
jgi:hypothetical protein